MKAIYINLDPYLQAVADWLNAGKPGTAPDFNPLPVAVTIPLGESAAIYVPKNSSGENSAFYVDGQILLTWCNLDTDQGDNIASDITPRLSKFGPPSDTSTWGNQEYCVLQVSGDMNVIFSIEDEETNTISTFTIPVLVRRETASGPVDLVDFTPPLSLAGVSFAGVDIEGAEFDGNEIVAAADTGALSAPAGA